MISKINHNIAQNGSYSNKTKSNSPNFTGFWKVRGVNLNGWKRGPENHFLTGAQELVKQNFVACIADGSVLVCKNGEADRIVAKNFHDFPTHGYAVEYIEVDPNLSCSRPDIYKLDSESETIVANSFKQFKVEVFKTAQDIIERFKL